MQRGCDDGEKAELVEERDADSRMRRGEDPLDLGADTLAREARGEARVAADRSGGERIDR